MDIKDLIVTPFFLVLLLVITYSLKSRFKAGSPLRKYYMPALWVKIFGALAMCSVYTFYYEGGDTTTFYNGSTVFWNSLLHDFSLTVRLFLSKSSNYPPEVQIFSPEGYYYIFKEPQSFFLIKLASLLGFITFDTFSAISVLFAVLSFTGLMALYKLFYELYPELSKELALAIFFLPSVVFWGSGLLKDTVTLGCLGWLIYTFYYVFILRKEVLINIFIMALSVYFIVNIKPYIFLSILPALLFWLVSIYRSRMKLKAARVLLAPLIILFAVALNYGVIIQLGEQFKSFSPDNIIQTANKYQTWHTTISSEGAGYTLGDFDQTIVGALKVFPQAVNVTLFRPYIWEANNVVMIMSSIESMLLLFFTIYVIFKTGLLKTIRIIYSKPNVLFCIFFSIFFAFAIGFSTYNFGALVRYKIPCIPLFLVGLFLIRHYAKSEKKLASLESTA